MKESVIKICMGSSCFARGNNENLTIIKEFLKINSIEAKVVLTGNLCEGRCNTGPNLFINNKLHQEVDSSKIDDFLNCLLLECNSVQA